MSLYTSVTKLEAKDFCEKMELFKRSYADMGPGTEMSFSHDFDRGHMYILMRNESKMQELLAMYTSVAYEHQESMPMEPWRFANLIDVIKEDILERKIVGFCGFNISTAKFVCILTNDLEIIPRDE